MSDRRGTRGHGEAGRDDDGLLEHLAGLPADMEVSYPAGRLATLIREEVRRRLNRPAVEWVGTPRAEDLLGWSGRKVRRRAQAWYQEQQQQERRPAVRVRKKNPEKKNSDWEFALDDLRRHGSRRNGSPASARTSPSENGGPPDGAEEQAEELSLAAVDEGLDSLGVG